MTKTTTAPATLRFTETDGIEYLAGGNSFRLGMRYDSMLRVGDAVQIADADGNRIGEETVADIFTGGLREMIRVHAENSYDFRKPNSEARKRDLRSAMEQWYAGNIVDDNSPCTVIYFEPRDEVEATLSTFVEDDGADIPVTGEDHTDGVEQLAAIMADVNSDIVTTAETATEDGADETETPTPPTTTDEAAA